MCVRVRVCSCVKEREKERESGLRSTERQGEGETTGEAEIGVCSEGVRERDDQGREGKGRRAKTCMQSGHVGAYLSVRGGTWH